MRTKLIALRMCEVNILLLIGRVTHQKLGPDGFDPYYFPI